MAESFGGVLAGEIDEIWPLIEDELWRVIVMTGGDHTLLTVKNALRNGDMQLWVLWADEDHMAARMVVVSEVYSFASGRKWCEIAFCAGHDHRTFVYCLHVIEQWAKSLGCLGIRIIGRRGWLKALKGYHEYATVLRKEF